MRRSSISSLIALVLCIPLATGGLGCQRLRNRFDKMREREPEVDKKAGMYFLGTFANEQAAEADRTDVGFFPFPLMGTQYDSEKAIDAPIDGFFMVANPANAAAAKALLSCFGTPEAQLAYVLSPGLTSVAVSPLADPSKYSDVQKAEAEILKNAGSIAQFLDRDARADFAGPSGMQGFLLSFLSDPKQDLDKFLGDIQAYYDTLPPDK